MSPRRPGPRVAAGGAALVAAGLFWTPAAAETFVTPDGCAHLATAQLRSCMAWQVLSCGPSAGDRTVHEFEGGALKGVAQYRNGLLEIDYVDMTGEPAIDVTYANEASVDRYDPLKAGARLSLSGEIRIVGPGLQLSGPTRYESRAAENARTVDGRTVHELTVASAARLEQAGGALDLAAEGLEFYSADIGSVIGYIVQGELAGEEIFVDQTPVSLSLPGEPGFGEIDPRTPCARESAWSGAIRPAGANDIGAKRAPSFDDER